jgi:very-short-patch-repair endonuclease
MTGLSTERELAPPPPERGRSDAEAERQRSEGGRVGVTTTSRFDRTPGKTKRARRLRQNLTIVESCLWRRLRAGQVDGQSFRRQHPAGPYVLDFYCSSLHLAIELDGGQHNFDAEAARDAQRDAWLKARGVAVLRFWNSDVIENMTGVLERIAIVVAELSQQQVTPTRPPSLRWRSASAADLPLSGGGGSKRHRRGTL